MLAVYSAQTKNGCTIVDTPTKPDGTTAPVGPFGAAQAPTEAAFPSATTPTTAMSTTFAQSQLGPTYAEIDTTASGTQSTGDRVAGAPNADAKTTHVYSFTSVPSIGRGASRSDRRPVDAAQGHLSGCRDPPAGTPWSGRVPIVTPDGTVGPPTASSPCPPRQAPLSPSCVLIHGVCRKEVEDPMSVAR